MFGLARRQAAPIEPLLPFAWPRKKTAAATAATKGAEDDGWVRVQVLQGGWNWNGCDGRALPAQLAGLATGVITDQSVCGHVQREEVSEKGGGGGGSSKAQGMVAAASKECNPSFRLVNAAKAPIPPVRLPSHYYYYDDLRLFRREERMRSSGGTTIRCAVTF